MPNIQLSEGFFAQGFQDALPSKYQCLGRGGFPDLLSVSGKLEFLDGDLAAGIAGNIYKACF